MLNIGRTLGQSPGFKKAFFVKGLSNLFNGDYDKAVGDFDVVIKMDSWSGKAYHYRGLDKENYYDLRMGPGIYKSMN